MNGILGSIVVFIVNLPPRVLSLLLDLIIELCGPNSSKIIKELEKFIRKKPCWVDNKVTQMTVSANAGESETEEAYKYVIEFLSVRMVVDFGLNFSKWFMPFVEWPVKPAKFARPHVLEEELQHDDIISRLGGIDMVCVFLEDIAFIMADKTISGISDISNNGSDHIFYMPQPVEVCQRRFGVSIEHQDADPVYDDNPHLIKINGQWCILRAVILKYSLLGWSFEACSINHPRKMSIGSRVFSRASVIEYLESEPALS